MSLSATAVAYEAQPRSPVAKLILIALADYADELGRVCMLWDHLAHFALCSRDHVEGHLRHLHADGHITYQAEENIVTIHGVAP